MVPETRLEAILVIAEIVEEFGASVVLDVIKTRAESGVEKSVNKNDRRIWRKMARRLENVLSFTKIFEGTLSGGKGAF